MAHANVVVETVLGSQKLVTISTVQPNEFFLENFIAIDSTRPRITFRSLFLVYMSKMEALDVTVEIILHFEESITVGAFEHVARVEGLVDGAHVVLHGVKTGKGFEA